MEPPATPWIRGKGPDHDVIEVRVLVSRSRMDCTWSMHDLLDDSDRDTALTWPTGGQRQVADALLVEAARRSALLELLRAMSKDKDLVTRLKTLTKDEQHARVAELSGEVVREMQRHLEDVVEAAMWEAVLGVLDLGR